MTAKPKETNVADKAIKGEWTLQSITYSEQGKFDVTLLNDTSKECFEGSTWKFVPNNNRGHYTINAGGCSTGQRNFIFVVQQIDKSTGYYDFLLKPTKKNQNLNQCRYSFALSKHIRKCNGMGTNRKSRWQTFCNLNELCKIIKKK